MSGVEQEVLDLVGLQLGTDSVRLGDRLVEDLGAESADVLNLVATLEDRYGFEIDEEEVAELTTVAEVCALVRARLAERAE